MNVFMINSGYHGCCYVRIQLPAWHNGFQMDDSCKVPVKKGDYLKNKASLLTEEEKKEIIYVHDPQLVQEALRNADVVVFHRPENEKYHDLADKLKEAGKMIVMDNDDTFKLDDVHPLARWAPDGTYQKELEYRDRNCDEFIKKAHLVTTSTEFLAREYRQISDNVVVLPNCVDPFDWEEPLKNETGKVRIGMVGSVAYEYDYQHIKPLLKELGGRQEVELVLFGLGDKEHRKKNPRVTKAFQEEYDFWDSVTKEQIPWCKVEEYPQKLNEARLDMMLIPRKENYFNKCKSNIKVLEAAMLEIPCIMQSYEDSPYEEFKDTGILVKDNKDWPEAVEDLIQNRDKRRQMGRNAKEYALNNYNIENNAHKWAEAYYATYQTYKR